MKQKERRYGNEKKEIKENFVPSNIGSYLRNFIRNMVRNFKELGLNLLYQTYNYSIFVYIYLILHGPLLSDNPSLNFTQRRG